MIRKEWSPEQISDRLAKEDNGKFNHEWIYRYIWADKEDGGDLHEHLRARKSTGNVTVQTICGAKSRTEPQLKNDRK